MESRWFNGVVVLFWLTTMSWLVIAKVLPPLDRGEPPNYQTVYAAQQADTPDPPVGWTLAWNDDELGWAVSQVEHTPSGVTQVHSRVHFDRIPLADITPKLLQSIMGSTINTAAHMQIDAGSTLEIDPLGKLAGFRSRLRVSDLPDAIQIRGTVEGSELTVNFSYGNQPHPPMKQYLPPDAMIGDELSPQGRMPGLHMGQTWTMPVCSPLRPEQAKIEILQASVEERESIVWNEQTVQTLVVVYRADSGTGFRAVREPRGKLWVDPSGTVLKQECNIYNSRLTFTRLNDDESVRIYAGLKQDPAFDLSAP